MPSISQGTLYRRKGTRNWSIKFYLAGQVRRESTGTTDRDEALAFLRRRIDEVASGRYVEIPQRLTFE
jgi:hypothetical protein